MAIGGRPVWGKQPVRAGSMTGDEQALLDRLAGSHDPDVAEMARQARDGDSDALIMLYDALQDAGVSNDEPIMVGLLDLIAYSLRPGEPQGEREAGGFANMSEARLERATSADAPPHGALEDSFRWMAGVNRDTLDEYMISQPDRPEHAERLADLHSRPIPQPPDNPLTQHGKKGRRRQMAYPGRPTWPAPSGHPAVALADERTLLQALAGSPDPDVAEMARQALAGDGSAMVMLHDAMLDAGYGADSRPVQTLLDLIGYTLVGTEPYHQRHAAGLPRMGQHRSQASMQPLDGGTPEERLVSLYGNLAPANRDVIGEFMVSRPDSGRPRPAWPDPPADPGPRRNRKVVPGNVGNARAKYAGRRPAKKPYPPISPNIYGQQRFGTADAAVGRLMGMWARHVPSEVRPIVETLMRAWVEGDKTALLPLGDLLKEHGQADWFDPSSLGNVAHGQFVRDLETGLVGEEGQGYLTHRARAKVPAPPLDTDTVEGNAAVIGDYIRHGEQYGPPRQNYRRKPRRYASQTEQNLSFEEAFARTQSADQQLYHDYGDQMLRGVGLEGKTYSAVGDWDDGAESSVVTEIPGAADLDALRYVAAWQGLAGNQRSVLVFAPAHGGTDSLYQVQVPETDVKKVRDMLSRAGVPYRSLIPGAGGTRVVVYDQGRALRDNIARFAQVYNAPIREAVGRGDYVGGGSRSDARAAYREEIARFESARGRREGDSLRQGQARQSDRRGVPQAAEA